MVSQAIAKGDIQAINYFVAQKYVEALKDIATSPNQKVFMMPVEATGILGAIAGVAELTKDSVSRAAGNAAPRATPPRSDRP
jgi:regulator of protease activity HflC (stomatin/prohibitin superfamily)